MLTFNKISDVVAIFGRRFAYYNVSLIISSSVLLLNG
jgi:hypothetical protein